MTPRKKTEAKATQAPQEAQETVQVPVEAVETQQSGDGHKDVSEVDLRGVGHQPENKVEDMPPLEVTPERGDTAQQRSDAAQQHPALRGAPEVEVSERTADASDAGMRFVKQFVVKVVGDSQEWLQQDETHVGHKLRTLEESTQRGLHAKGEVQFDGAEDHGDGVSTILTYSVEVIPAVIDSEAATTMTVSHNEMTGDCPTRDALAEQPEPDTSK